VALRAIRALAVAWLAAGQPALAACDDLPALEPLALLGRLTPEDRACLLALRDATDDAAVRERAGRILLADAWARDDRAGWEEQARYLRALGPAPAPDPRRHPGKPRSPASQARLAARMAHAAENVLDRKCTVDPGSLSFPVHTVESTALLWAICARQAGVDPREADALLARARSADPCRPPGALP
jgi:hypothetical protein